MPQGKFKVKNKAPIDIKKKTKTICARKNCPAAPTKWKYIEGQKIKNAITKNVNRKVEEEIRAVVTDAPKVYLAKKKKQIKQTVESKQKQSCNPSNSSS